MKIYLGAMSGTSCDGFDITACTFTENGHLNTCLATDFTPYPDSIAGRLHAITMATHIKKSAVNDINRALSHFWADAINNCIEKNNLNRSDIEAIGIHGHTIDHQTNTQSPGSWQLCEPNLIAAKTGITVISDFRNMDIALGGQGAPLLPPVHAMLFQTAEKSRAICNIGGIANITILSEKTPLIGFDTGPGNTLMDAWARHAFEKDFDYDGEIAKQGHINENLLNTLLSDPYFKEPSPKSTGREAFNMAWLEAALESTEFQISNFDLMTTLTELTAKTIADAIKLELESGEVILCGGGSMNTFLTERISTSLGDSFTLCSSDKYDIHPNFLEALGFAWLSYRRMNLLPGNSPHTGATKLGLLGGVFHPAEKSVQLAE